MFKSDGMLLGSSPKGSLFPALISGGAASVLASIATAKGVHLSWFSAFCHFGIFLLPVFWAAFIFLVAVNQILRSKKSLIKKYYWRIMGSAVFTGIALASLLVPVDVFAQPAPAGGGGKCSSLAFLAALGTLTQNTFSGLATGNSTGGANVDLASQACGLLLLFVWLIVVVCFIGCIGTVINLYDSRGGGWGQAGQNLIIPAFFIVSVLSMFAMFGVA